MDLGRIVGPNNEDGHRPVLVDGELLGAHGALVVIGVEHYRIHQHQVFTVSAISEGVVDDASVEVLIRVPSGYDCHIDITGTASHDAFGYIFDTPTVTADGTPLTPHNHSRNVPEGTPASVVSVFNAPTISDDGTEIFATYLPGGQKNQATGGSAAGAGEWNLHAGDYLLRFTNKGGQAAIMSMTLWWYEGLEENPLEQGGG